MLFVAAAAMMFFTACTEKENQNDNPDNPTPSGLAGQLVGTWQSEHIFVNGEEVNAQLTIVMNADGTGTISEREDTFTWVVNGNNVIVTNPHGNTFTYTVTNISEDGFVISGNYIPGHDEQVAFEGYFRRAGGDNPDPGDLGVSTPELVQSTAHTITVSAHITGSVDQYLGQFPNYMCGITWCNVNQPSEMEHNMLDCTAQARDDNGFFECTIDGLEEGHEYDVAAWLKLTPESQPIIGPTHMYTTEGGGDNPGTGDTNWIVLDGVGPRGSTVMFVSVRAYFDGDPTAVGVVYNTTGNPTLADQVYNAFDHLNMETGEHDETIESVNVYNDGSRRVDALISGLQANTTYYFRAYYTLGDGTTVYSNEESHSTHSDR